MGRDVCNGYIGKCYISSIYDRVLPGDSFIDEDIQSVAFSGYINSHLVNTDGRYLRDGLVVVVIVIHRLVVRVLASDEGMVVDIARIDVGLGQGVGAREGHGIGCARSH